jgi:hypothetical protein
VGEGLHTAKSQLDCALPIKMPFLSFSSCRPSAGLSPTTPTTLIPTSSTRSQSLGPPASPLPDATLTQCRRARSYRSDSRLLACALPALNVYYVPCLALVHAGRARLVYVTHHTCMQQHHACNPSCMQGALMCTFLMCITVSRSTFLHAGRADVQS